MADYVFYENEAGDLAKREIVGGTLPHTATISGMTGVVNLYVAKDFYTVETTSGNQISFGHSAVTTITITEVSTLDGSDYTVTWADGSTSTHASGAAASKTYGSSTSGDISIVATSQITRLTLSGSFTGDISSVSALTSLTYLWLNGSGFTGDMSGVSALTSLTVLFLSGNFTGDMSGVSELTSLTFLRLSGSFTGDISSVSALTSLTYLWLNGSGFTGDMSGVSALTSLTVLFLSGNFTGDMSGVSALTSLTTLQLIGIGFTGDIPSILSGITANATSLFLSGNFTVTGTISKSSGASVRAECSLTSSEVDNLLIELDKIPTWTGAKLIDLDGGGNAARTSASDAAVSSLQGKGVTVQTAA